MVRLCFFAVLLAAPACLKCTTSCKSVRLVCVRLVRARSVEVGTTTTISFLSK